MTMDALRKKVTSHDLKTKSVYVDTLAGRFRLIQIGRTFIRLMSNGGEVKKAYPEAIQSVEM
jgi:hypothetical protein